MTILEASQNLRESAPGSQTRKTFDGDNLHLGSRILGGLGKSLNGCIPLRGDKHLDGLLPQLQVPVLRQDLQGLVGSFNGVFAAFGYGTGPQVAQAGLLRLVRTRENPDELNLALARAIRTVIDNRVARPDDPLDRLPESHPVQTQ